MTLEDVKQICKESWEECYHGKRFLVALLFFPRVALGKLMLILEEDRKKREAAERG